MIEKLEFYHGAAIVRVIEDPRCRSIGKSEYGYLVNGDRLVYLKYSTKAHSPWRFTITVDDVTRLDEAIGIFGKCVVGFVCGGDGVCPVRWKVLKRLIGAASTWIAAKRSFNGCYSVSGPEGKLKRKVALNQWPAILFEDEETDVE
jgi:hypothetical protein